LELFGHSLMVLVLVKFLWAPYY